MTQDAELNALDARIQAAKSKTKELEKLRREVAARKKAETKKQARRDDTRRKILAGAWILEAWRGAAPKEFIETLKRPGERALFGAAEPDKNESRTEVAPNG